MKIALIAAEMGPRAKAGGLADVIGALPSALQRAGAQPSLILPAYPALLEHYETAVLEGAGELMLGTELQRYRVLSGKSPDGVSLYLIDHAGFFARGGIYGQNGADYPDNAQRFIFFGRAAALLAASLSPDVLHAHDWHAAASIIAARADASLRAALLGASLVFTIHNLAFQGIFDHSDYPLLGIDPSWYSPRYLEFYGRLNLMKGAITLADAVSTVSPGYAREVASDPQYGFGLEGVLRDKGDHFVGILNGADYDEWNPATDKMISVSYTPARRAGKKACLYDLREELHLPHRMGVPVIGMVTRMTEQKGINLLAQALDQIMTLDLQMVMLANGDPRLEQFFQDAERRYPEKLRVILGFDNGLAHRIQAGSDMFLMPSRYEPCGLTQMYALKYGAAPIVRATGGLKDTVADFDSAMARGNGFVFSDFTPDALTEAIHRATATYADHRQWRQLMTNCFAADFSWDRSAREYLDRFERLIAERASQTR